MERLDIQSAYLPCHQLSVRSCNIGSALVFAGIGCASANGILVKGSNYLEGLSDTKYVVFDKTGTLTKGVFEVTGVYPETDTQRIPLYAWRRIPRVLRVTQ